MESPFKEYNIIRERLEGRNYFTSMDIKAKIEDLKVEREKQKDIKERAHQTVIDINIKIRKLETVLKNAGEILFENATEETEQSA